MKTEGIRKRLFMESGIFAGILAALGGIIYFLGTVISDYEGQKTALSAQLAAVRQDKTMLQNKFDKINNNTDLYAQISGADAQEKLGISRQFLRKKINDFKARYFLNAFSLTMSPIQDLSGDKYRFKNTTISSSDLSASFDALTDEDIYSLTKALENELPGSIRITQLRVERAGKVTNESLRAIAKNGQYTMVKGDMKFTWFGIRPPEPAESEAGK